MGTQARNEANDNFSIRFRVTWHCSQILQPIYLLILLCSKVLRGHLDLYFEFDKHDRIFNFELHFGRTGTSKCR
jgi:hypothetical protein